MNIKDLFFKITGRDDSGSAFGSVNRRLRETDGLAASLSERMDRAGRSMQRYGAAGTLASFGVAAAFRDVIGLYDEQARAEQKVAQAVRQTGGAAGFTADELYDMASALQGITRVGDEETLNKVTAQFLTFKNIAGEVFADAQMAALDLAAVLDGDLQSASIMLGKALNDPVAGLSAMSRAGVTFSNAQQDIIKDLARTGRVADAQRLILDEIASAYGGQAIAARDAGAGIVDAWENTWGDLKEIVGGVLVDLLPPIVDTLEDIAGAFRDMSPQGQRAVVVFGALAVAIPPVTAALGLMVSGMAALSAPVTLAIAGISGLATAAALLWPEQDRVTQSADLVTAALADEITQTGLLQQALASDARMSAAAAMRKLTEAQARHENVRAIIEEQRALKLGSDEYGLILKRIDHAQSALNSLGFPANDIATPRNAEEFENWQQTMVDLRKEQADFLRADKALSDQYAATRENVEALEVAIANARDGLVTFGDAGVVPVQVLERIKSEITGTGGGSGGSGGGVAGALGELTVKVEDFAGSDAWGEVRQNLRAMIADGQSMSDTLTGIFGAVTDRLFDLAFSPAWDKLWDGMGSAMGLPSGGADGAPSSGGLGSWVGNVLGLDTGGDVTVSGRGGVDRNLTVLRTSDAERVSVRRPGDASGMGAQVVVNIMTPNPQAFQASRAQIGQQISRAVAAGQRIA